MKILTIIILLFHLNVNAQEISEMKIDELEKYIQSRTTPSVFNFWATWCGPCIEEMPWFNKIIGQNKNVELIFVSLDNQKAYPDKIRALINRNNIKATLIWLNETNADVFCPAIDADWGGSIPASLFINHKKSYRKFIENQISPTRLRKELRKLTSR